MKLYPPNYPPIRDHAWVGVAGHPDDFDCSACGEPEDDHEESTR